MDVSQFDVDLDEFLSKHSIDVWAVLDFLSSLVHLSNELKVENHFQTYCPLVKRWFGAYQTISNEGKMDESALKCIRKSYNILTDVFLRLMQSFNEHEPSYNSDLYYEWKVIISVFNGQRRAKAFCRYVLQFKNLVENLRAATNRCDQLAILSVLIRYTEQVSLNELLKLKERSNSHIVDKLAVLKDNPTLTNQNAFLHEMNAAGHSIISLRATKIICEQMSLNLTTSSNVLWIDFNMSDHSVTIVAISPTENTSMCFATVPRPKLKERLCEEHELRIRGAWTVLANGNVDQNNAIINVYLPILDRNAAWKAKVKSIFTFVSDASSKSIFSQDLSQVSQMIDQRLIRQLPVDVFPDGCNESLSQNNRSDTSLSCSQLMKNPIVHIARKPLDIDNDEESSCLHKFNNCTAVATKEWVGKTSINKSIENESASAIPMAQHSVGGQSSGISFCNDMSVLDYDESGSHTSHENFSPVLNEHVKNFIGGSTSTSPAKPFVEKPKFQTPENHYGKIETIAQVTDAVCNLRGMSSPASSVKSFEDDSINHMFDNIVWQTAASQPINISAEISFQKDRESNKMLSPVRTSPSYQEPTEVPSNPTTTDIANIYNVAPPTITSRINFDQVVGPDQTSTERNPELLEDIKMLTPPISITHRSCNLPAPKAGVIENDLTDYDQNQVDDPKAVSVEQKTNDVDLEVYADGIVYDELGCVFVNKDEVEEAWNVYIEHNGLEYLKSEEFKAASVERRARSEREFRMIDKMMKKIFYDDGPAAPILPTSRGTSKRKSSDSFVNINKRRTMEHSSEGLNRSHTTGCFEPAHSFEKQNGSDKTTANQANANTDKRLQSENQNAKDVECKIAPHGPIINYLDDFSKERKTCEVHQGLLLQLIQELQTTVTPRSSSKYGMVKTIQSIKMVCEQSRSNAAMILHKATNS